MPVVDSGKDSIMEISNTILEFVLLHLSFRIFATTFFVATAALAQTRSTKDAPQEKTPVAISDKAHPPQLSGTVVDTSGAVIAGATVLVWSANGTVQRTTQSDR